MSPGDAGFQCRSSGASAQAISRRAGEADPSPKYLHDCDLDVSFQKVVHSALTEEAEVAEASDPRGEPNGRAQECASDAERSRGDGAERDRGWVRKSNRRAAVQHHGQDRRQMGRSLPRRGRRRIE